jgi:hypothetical protein
VAAKNKSVKPVGQSWQYLASGVGCYILNLFKTCKSGENLKGEGET